jgi:branched-chain amino acid transport system ATP-binding protein
LLTIRNLHAGYGDISVLRDVTMEVPAGKIVALIGANGAGKTTLLRAISGLVETSAGEIIFEEQPIHAWPSHRIVAVGLVQVPEGRHLFPDMTIQENLELGSFKRGKRERKQSIDRVYNMFPKLAERRTQLAGTMSGGEQQMLAIGRALMTEPKLLMLDEPSLGLAPIIVQDIFRIIEDILEFGATVLIVEQNAVQTLGLADHAYVLENGEIVLNGTGHELLKDEQIRTAYLGL